MGSCMDKNEPHSRTLIAIPTDDGETIFPGMMGRAGQFYIFEIESGESIRLKEKRTNPYAKIMQHLLQRLKAGNGKNLTE